MEDAVKLALVEQKLEDLKPIIFKLDATIEKLSEVNTTVSRMLAGALQISGSREEGVDRYWDCHSSEYLL